MRSFAPFEVLPIREMRSEDEETIQCASAPSLNDEDRLAQIGHRQELGRTHSLWSLSAFSLCLMATWEALTSVSATALVSGGPPCLLYNYIVSFLCTICVSTSLAEIASIYPTAGGQYHWVAALSPPRTKLIASYFTGWISIGGQVVFTASAAFAAGLQVQSLISLNHDSYLPTRWQGMLFFWGALVYAGALNIWAVKAMPHINLASGVVHLAAFVGIVIALGVVGEKSTASFVFSDFVNSSGWRSDSIFWLIGLLSAVYPLLGYDAACHLAEEMPNASRNVPLAMVGSVIVNGFMGLVFCIVLLFSSGSLDRLLDPSTPFSYMNIFLNATESRVGTSVMVLTLVTVAMTATVSGVASTSRTVWAFARDNATPFDEFFSYVDPKLQVPIRAVLLVTALQALLGFLYLGNETAFNAVLSTSILGLYLSYLLPIAYMAFTRRRNPDFHKTASFRLGSVAGFALNAISVVWMVLVMVFSTLPGTYPVTPQSMNYSSVVLIGWIALGAIHYVCAARQKFQIPMTEADSFSENGKESTSTAS